MSWLRRSLVILALGSVVGPLLGSGTAAAHVCALPIEVDVGETATLTIGVGAESTAVTEVQIEVPDGFRLTEATGDGWQIETEDDVVRFSGSSIAPFACGYVTLRGVADERGTLVFPLVMETAAGDSVRYDSAEPYLEESAQLVYAGVEPPALPGPDDSGTEPMEVVGLVLIAVGVVAAGWFGVSWWRSRAAVGD